MKKLTKKEKELRAKVREELKAKGILPPDKKKLNRKKFIEEAKEEWKSVGTFEIITYLRDALVIIMNLREKNLSISLEAIGAAKVVKLAIRLKEFEQMVKERGDTKYKIGEQFEYIKDILEA